MSTKLAGTALVGTMLAVWAPVAAAHDFRCEKRVCLVERGPTGLPLMDPAGLPSCAAAPAGSVTVSHYPALLAFRVDLANVTVETSVVTGVFDPILAASPATFGATIEPGFAVSVGGTATEVFVVPVASREACLALFGPPPPMEPAVCSSVVENRFVVEHDVGSAECRARVVCGAEQQPGPAVFTITPATHDFGPVTVGSASSFFPFSVTNVGGSTGTFGIGATTSDFGMAIGLSPCARTAIAPGASCTVLGIFSPHAVGPQSATVQVVDANGTVTGMATVTGTGVAPVTATATTAP